ncbi:MAG: tRNA (adenosine(37)-N6)-threonylcarbamoyltransferase complex dimerization subunit type 1 TsaB [Endomicrobia bacterium]|nr:tRNA (adenosine(37)-N6)-threonylcarbamoyltransferase complex dimerization subunit type 1 TsaB [Endomicrobiia bacterium]MCL2507056.1 tRNA (adenosine(37)-N6)-threonylcarbamoyltransferase complex dimerization subunit type 1 TsaB [Endomicrobiia bacterium]
MKILAVETSGKTFSIALNDSGKTLASFIYDCGHIHSEMIVPAIERILKDTGNTYQNIDKFAVSTGPGSFTGIRVGMTAVKTMAQAINKPVVAIDTLTILENSFPDIKGVKLVTAIDALRNEIYVKSKKEIIIKSIDDFIAQNKKYKNKIIVIGDASIVYKDKLAKSLGSLSVSIPAAFSMPKASVLAELAQFYKSDSFSNVSPLYIRRSWAEETKK